MNNRDTHQLWEAYNSQLDETVYHPKNVERMERQLQDAKLKRDFKRVKELQLVLKHFKKRTVQPKQDRRLMQAGTDGSTGDLTDREKIKLAHAAGKMGGKPTGKPVKKVVAEDEYGPSGAPSMNVAEWKLDQWLKSDDWHDPKPNPWDKYVDKVLENLHDEVSGFDDTGEGRTYIAWFGAPRGTKDYEEWTDASIIVAFYNNQEEYGGDMINSIGIFVNNDGQGESFTLPDRQLEELLQVNKKEIDNEIASDEDYEDWDPYGPKGVVDRSDFY